MCVSSPYDSTSLCCCQSTAFADAGWREVEWYRKGYLSGGMGNLGGDDGESTSQQHRERLWCSPHCLGAEVPQLALFDAEALGDQP